MIQAIACVGRNGQLGLDGMIPWKPDAAPGDLRWFKDMTMKADFCVVGKATADKLPPLPGRQLVTWSGRGVVTPQRLLADVGYNPDEDLVMVIGGAKTYEAFRPLITRWHIGVADYEGDADVWMPKLWL